MFNRSDYQDIPMWEYHTGSTVDVVAISDDGNYAVASNGLGFNAFFFNTTDYDGIPMWQWFSAGNSILDFAISSDGKYVALSSTNKIFYFNHSLSGGQKLPMWSTDPPDTPVSVDITADGKYVVGGTDAVGTAYLLNNSITNPKDHEWSSAGMVKDIAISGWGDYFAVGNANEEIILYHHARPIPPILRPLLGDDDDDDEGTPAIPFGNYYLVFAIISIIGLIIITKRKVFLEKFKI